MSRKYFALSVLILFALQAAAQPLKITVAADGSGNYRTVQAAFDAIAKNNPKPVTIFVKKGIYKEKLLLDSLKTFVTLIGEDKFTTILTYDDHTGKLSPRGDTITTRSSCSFLIRAANFSAANITFQNDAGPTAGQAVAVESDGDRAIFDNCRFIGFQDVLFISNARSRQFYFNCYIEGTTDFIFGAATAWFQQCHIHSKKNSYITAASTPQDHPFGYIFYDCMLTGDTGVHSAFLGRPWRPYAAVAYIHCFIGDHVKTEGWSKWNNLETYSSARYAEYENYGPAADTTTRVSWSKQFTAEEVKKYTVKNVFNGWDPEEYLTEMFSAGFSLSKNIVNYQR